MTTNLRLPPLRPAAPEVGIPPLENGDRLNAKEFMRRYKAMPARVKAELIQGVVYMASPVALRRHGKPHFTLSSWLTFYVFHTPGVEAATDSTTELGDDDTPQPDLSLRLPESAGGRARVTDDDYLAGPPELVCEVASSSASYDLGAKLATYRDFGVQEYLVWRARTAAVDWFALRDGDYVPLDPDPADGLFRSAAFPGLWLDPAALLAHDLPKLAAAVDRGRATPEHAAFAAKLAGATT